MANPLIFVFFILISCSSEIKTTQKVKATPDIIVGAERMDIILPMLSGKTIAGVFNQSSLVKGRHIVDSLISSGIDVSHIYTLEHGFRGDADAGAKIDNEVDPSTGIKLVSLYGQNKKPSKSSLEGIDIVLFDVQDVGVRFYTYISTLHYVMEACAESGVKLIILDRPNPNGHCVDGPLLDSRYKSFVGMHPIPVLHGMTIGEYGLMVKGEGWINKSKQLDLEVIALLNYDHQREYILPVKPSPNLPNNRSIYLYPSLCFFEGTSVSIGRGTDKQFQVIGHPALDEMEYEFTPVSMPGATQPKHQGVISYGEDLSTFHSDSIRTHQCLDISYLIKYYKALKDKNESFFTSSDFFDKLAGSDELRMMIEQGKSEEEIRDSWKEGLESFEKVRSKYLLYE